jgi:class 3 adenylate cyclase
LSADDINYGEENPQLGGNDTEALVTQTQRRVWKALKRLQDYDSSFEAGKEYLLDHASSKVRLIIMYVDLVSSTNMSMTLPVDKLVTIIRAFSHEVTSVIQSHGGYVLKYVGDAVITFFPSISNRIAACTNSVKFGRAILSVIKNGINPILDQYDYPELSVKIGIDEGENVVVLYGQDRSSLVDILGYCISIPSKITSITEADRITVGEDVYFALDPALRGRFSEIRPKVDEWKYTNGKNLEFIQALCHVLTIGYG